MKLKTIASFNSSARLIYHFFALTGIITSLFAICSWIKPEKQISNSTIDMAGLSPDVNISVSNARDYIQAYRTAYLGTESRLPKGYFISRQAINWLLSDESLGGIYVYPALTSKGVICTVIEGGNNANARYSLVEGIDGRVMMSESTCPTDCGALGQ